MPGSHDLLEALRGRGLKLYLASGTHLKHVRFEADLLELSPFFGREINAPDGDDTAFSKRAVIERILAENRIRGEELLSFGDGVVETEEVRRVGGTAVAVASDLETGRHSTAGSATASSRPGPTSSSPITAGTTALLRWLFHDC